MAGSSAGAGAGLGAVSHVTHESAVAQLLTMFPDLDEALITNVLNQRGRHLEGAIESLIQLQSESSHPHSHSPSHPLQHSHFRWIDAHERHHSNVDTSPHLLPTATPAKAYPPPNTAVSGITSTLHHGPSSSSSSSSSSLSSCAATLPDDFLRPPSWFQRDVWLGPEQSMADRDLMIAAELQYREMQGRYQFRLDNGIQPGTDTNSASMRRKLAAHQSRNRAATADELHAAAVGGAKGLTKLHKSQQKQVKEQEKKTEREAAEREKLRVSLEKEQRKKQKQIDKEKAKIAKRQERERAKLVAKSGSPPSANT